MTMKNTKCQSEHFHCFYFIPKKHYMQDFIIDRLNFLMTGQITGYFKHRDVPSGVRTSWKIIPSTLILVFYLSELPCTVFFVKQ